MKQSELLPDEKIEGVFTPTLASFLPVFSPYLYLVTLSVFFLLDYEYINNTAKALPLIGNFLPSHLSDILFNLFLMLPIITVSLLKIKTRLLLIFISICLSGFYLDLVGLRYAKFYLAIAVGIIALFLINMYRKGHRYYVTNYRLILERTFLRYDRRELMLEKVQDLAIEQGILGRIFNFGNIIPTSAAGMGTGFDQSNILIGFGAKIPKTPLDINVITGEGKAITGFRARSNNCFYGVSDPRKISNIISKLMYTRSESTKLDEIKKILEKK